MGFQIGGVRNVRLEELEGLLDNRLSAILLELQSRSSIQDELTETKEILLRVGGYLETRGDQASNP